MKASTAHVRRVPAPDVCRLRRLLPWALALLVPGFATPGLAASIPYGDFGPGFPPGIVRYQDVREDSGTDPVPPGRFGAPSLSGDALDFDPSAFVASATGGASDLTDGQLNFELDVLASGGAVAGGVTSLLFSEAGDFTLLGGGTALTQIAAGIAVRIDILEVDGTPIAPIEVLQSLSIGRDLVSDGPAVVVPWSRGLLVELGPVLASHAIDYELGVTRAEIALDDQLVAISEPGSVAFVAKKQLAIRPGVVPNPGFAVPEPEPALLLLAALAGAFRRRPAFA